MFLFRFWILLLFFSFQQGTTASDRYAFVSIYYPNNYRSQSDLIAIRTLYKSYVSIKSKAEFLVLSTKDISQSDLKQTLVYKVAEAVADSYEVTT